MRIQNRPPGTILLVLTVGFGLVSLGSSCRTEAPRPDEATPPALDPDPHQASPRGADQDPAEDTTAGGGGGAGDDATSDEAMARALPGVDVSGLDSRGRRTLLKVAEDAVCDCGRPSTLAGCLREPAPCELGRRMADLSVLLIKANAGPSEAVSFTEDYFEGFKASRRKHFEINETTCKGPANAPIQLVEFADFECPYCGLTWPLFGEIVKSMGGKARLCFLNFPLSQHEHAREAAQLVILAGKKGKFVAAADLFFANQAALDRKSLLGYAEKIGLDRAEAARALEEGTYDPVVEKERKQGLAAGIEGTPSLFINGRPYTLLLDAAMIRKAIDDELAWQENGPTWAKAGPGSPR